MNAAGSNQLYSRKPRADVRLFAALAIIAQGVVSCRTLPPELNVHPLPPFRVPEGPPCRVVGYLAHRCLSDMLRPSQFCPAQKAGAHLACSRHRTCDAFMACWERVQRQERRKELAKTHPEKRRHLARIMALPIPKRWRRAYRFCGYHCSGCGTGLIPERLPLDARKQCEGMLTKAAAYHSREIRVTLKRREVRKTFHHCRKLLCFAWWIDKAAMKAAMLLCKDVLDVR